MPSVNSTSQLMDVFHEDSYNEKQPRLAQALDRTFAREGCLELLAEDMSPLTCDNYVPALSRAEPKQTGLSGDIISTGHHAVDAGLNARSLFLFAEFDSLKK